ncbi:MAG: hypothetical protein AAF799_29125 [Myxococcota bacterium]
MMQSRGLVHVLVLGAMGIACAHSSPRRAEECGSPVRHAQASELPSTLTRKPFIEERTALYMLQGLSEDIRISDEAMAGALKAVEQIHQLEPEIDFRSFAIMAAHYPEIELQLSPQAVAATGLPIGESSDFEEQMKCRGAALPEPLGYAPLDQALERLGVHHTEVSTFLGLTAHFEGQFDHENLVEALLEVEGVDKAFSAMDMPTMDGGTRPYLVQRPEVTHVVFEYGEGDDCPSGCPGRFWYFTWDRQTGTVTMDAKRSVSEAMSGEIYHFGIPERESANPFADAAALREMTESTVWWERQHAVLVALQMLISDEGMGVGEEDLDKYRRIRQEVIADREAWEAIVMGALRGEDATIRARVWGAMFWASEQEWAVDDYEKWATWLASHR